MAENKWEQKSGEPKYTQIFPKYWSDQLEKIPYDWKPL